MSQSSLNNKQVHIRTLIKEISLLSRVLPTTVRLAVDRDKIPVVLGSDAGESPWQTFNKRLTILCKCPFWWKIVIKAHNIVATGQAKRK